MRRFIAAITGFVVALVVAGAAGAGPLADGQAAYARGDWASAVGLLRPLAEQGDATAQSYLGTMVLAGQGVPPDPALAVVWLKKSADQGSATSQFLLCRIYGGDFSLTGNDALAARWCRKAAERDGDEASADAQLELSRLYRMGRGVPRDDKLASRWAARAATGFQRLAERGDVHGRIMLAAMLNVGEGLPRDRQRAESLYLEVAAVRRKAADQGDAVSQVGLARMYQAGAGVPRDGLQAAIWLRRAADQGDAPAQIALGTLYLESGFFGLDSGFTGYSDPEDEVQGYIWTSLGSTRLPPGLAIGLAKSRDNLRVAMSAAQRADADREIAAWRPVKETPREDGSAIEPTTAQKAEAARLAAERRPTQAQIEAAEQAAHAFDMAMGSPGAAITVVEYLSLGAPHAARFNNEVLPAFKAKYIATGRVRFVVRELEIPRGEMSVAGALLARCVGRDRYFEVLDAIFHAQAAMVESGDVHAGLLGVARSIGMTETRFDACISDPAAIKALDDRHRTFMVQEHISAVPTFVVNGLKLEGNQSLEQLDAAVDRALAGAAPSVRNTEPSANRASLGARGLSFRAVDKEAGADPRERPPTTGDERLPQTDGADLWLRSAAVITTAMIGSAEVDTDQMGRPSVSFRLTEQGRRRFAAFTAANVGRQFAIVWNGEVVSAPLIRSPITGPEGMIVGHFTAQAAAEMARSIASQPP